MPSNGVFRRVGTSADFRAFTLVVLVALLSSKNPPEHSESPVLILEDRLRLVSAVVMEPE